MKNSLLWKQIRESLWKNLKLSSELLGSIFAQSQKEESSPMRSQGGFSE